MARGKLRIYLGAAPGVGKTYAMLNEGWRGHQRGKDVVVAYVEDHARPNTAAQVRDLEVIPRRTLTYRGQQFDEMDVDAVIARHPTIALVDELAHSNVPGSRHAKRWEDINDLLDAGVDVISTVNIQHLESLNDVIQRITGAPQRETVPDAVVRAADQIELVDMSPESLRRRMAHGNIYKPDQADAALGNYFRVGNLTALRELALLWVADRVEEGLQQYRERHGIAEPWETKERVVVALTGSPKGERLIRRGARMAARARAELVGVHIRATDGLARGGTSQSEVLEHHRTLLAELGGRFAEVTGSDIASALMGFAKAENATQLLLGATDRSRWTELFQGSVINQVIRQAEGIDVHVIGSGDDGGATNGRRRLPRLPTAARPAALPPHRHIAAWLLALVGIPLVVLGLSPLRSSFGPTGALPELLLAVVVVAVVGGLFPALVGALVAFGFADWFLIPPIHTFTFGRTGDAVALATFVVVAVLVSMLIDLLARRAVQVERARAESEALARLAGGAVLSGRGVLSNLVEELRMTFGVDAVAVLQAPEQPGAPWAVLTGSGPAEAITGVTRPEDAAFSAPLAEGSVLVVSGRAGGGGLGTDDRRLLQAFAAQLRVAQQQERLAETAASAVSLAEANELRNALLAAVSHDLRTPLASIKASATSLLSEEVPWGPEERKAFCETIDVEADRLNTLVGNLLDMSRLQTGALALRVRPIGLEEVVFSALASLSADTSGVNLDVPETLPPVAADPALLERAVANVVGNALSWSPPGEVVRVVACAAAPGYDVTLRSVPGIDDRAGAASDPTAPCGRIELRIIDRGPGIPVHQREEVFRPFQRLGDARGPAPTDGVGLGLAVARGFVEAMGGELTLDDTPGGGLTAAITLAVAALPSLEPAGTPAGRGNNR